MDFREDLYTHGKFSIPVRKGSRVGVIVSLKNPAGRDAFRLFREEKRRRENLLKEFPISRALQRLILAADQFVVARDDMFTILAGYPWFSDWGRDTMISLTGLCLVTWRHKEAKKILQKFAEYIDGGMIPNRFPDSGHAPEYNTVDATLWMFQAIYKYYLSTGDKLFVRNVLPLLRSIIDAHYAGTRYNIQVDPNDELLTAGAEHVQLTWMDAKVGDWVVTPRRGKAVEVNALWFNALCVMRFLAEELNYHGDAEFFKSKAQEVKKNFNLVFWNKIDQCLFDYIENGQPNRDIRPNQLYAVGLPFNVLDKGHHQAVIDTARKHLLTPRGLRSLSPLHSEYKPQYKGDVLHRDGAYHQGTVWSYLIGIYIDALFVAQGEQARDEAEGLVNHLFEHLDEAGVGTISEIFDANAPHKPKGCIAQAWSVAELLRVCSEYNLAGFHRSESTHVRQSAESISSHT